MDGIAESRPDMNIKVAAYTVTHLPNFTLDVKELPDPQIEDHRRGFRLTVVSDKIGQ